MSTKDFNLSYLKKINKSVTEILFSGAFTSLSEFDQCTQTWHPAGFQGPFFIVDCGIRTLIILNQNSTSDFVRVPLRWQLQKGDIYHHFQFSDENQKIYNIWFQDLDEYLQFEAIMK